MGQMAASRHARGKVEAEVVTTRLTSEREGDLTLASGDSGTSAGSSTDSVDLEVVVTDSVDSAFTLQ